MFRANLKIGKGTSFPVLCPSSASFSCEIMQDSIKLNFLGIASCDMATIQFMRFAGSGISCWYTDIKRTHAFIRGYGIKLTSLVDIVRNMTWARGFQRINAAFESLNRTLNRPGTHLLWYLARRTAFSFWRHILISGWTILWNSCWLRKWARV